MVPRKLNYQEYREHFQFNRPDTGCGIEVENKTLDKCFCIQTYIPKSFLFNIPYNTDTFVIDWDSIPQEIHIKFELFATGSIGDAKSYIFKPWLLNIENITTCRILERFHLFIPNYLFYNLINRLIFQEQHTWKQLHELRIIQDTREAEFTKFGLLRYGGSAYYETNRLRVRMTIYPNPNEIKTFYRNNWDGIEPHLEKHYFNPSFNLWFEVKDLFTYEKIGYIRLYNKESVFNGGTSLEYIISKPRRGYGLTTEAVLGLIEYLKTYSMSFKISAEVDEENTSSNMVLLKSGFTKADSNHPMFKEDYVFDIVGRIDSELNTAIATGSIDFAVDKIYFEKYERYFHPR